jgi:hypothetical protein
MIHFQTGRDQGFLHKILIFLENPFFISKIWWFFPEKNSRISSRKTKKIQKTPNFMVGKSTYFQKKISGAAGEQSFRKIGDLFP